MICINSITICPENITITKGKWYYGICANICPTNATCRCVTWHSSNSNVANVNQNGYIFGVSEGVAVIYATAQDGSGAVGFCNVTVVSPVKVSSVTVTPSTKTVNVGDTVGLSATVCPTNAEDKRIRWTSCDCNVADVDYLTGCVTAKAAGTTCICANAVDGSGVQGCCEVTVNTQNIDSIGVFRNLSMLSATPSDTETGAPAMLGLQFRERQDGNHDIRLISQIKTLYYKILGFEIHSKYGDAAPVSNILCSKIVYTSLLADEETVYPNDGFDYFVVDVIENVPENTVASFKIVPFAITLEGEFLRGSTATFSFEGTEQCDYVDFEIPECLSTLDHIRVNTGNGSNLDVMSLPNENSTVLGQFANEKQIALVIDTPQNEKWYAVYGRTTDGTYQFGWCYGEYLGNDVTYAKSVYASTLNVRSSHSSSSEKLGTISNGDVVVVLEANCYNDGTYIWHKILYNDTVAYVVAELSVDTDKPNFDIYTEFVPLVTENNSIEKMLNNIENCSSSVIPTSKKEACVAIARAMFSEGYKPAFVAGMLSNIKSEGDIGFFESSNYTSHPEQKPDYLVYMDTNYNGANFYRINYSGKTIMDVNVITVYDMLSWLKNNSDHSQGDWRIGSSRVGFGLGSLQWTFSRSFDLIRRYMHANNNSNTITKTQAIQAESAQIIDELKQSLYKNIVTEWENSSFNNLASTSAANQAASLLCLNYLKPDEKNTQASIRGKNAEIIYEEMMK